MNDTLIGRETPIHFTKYDGSYHRRWPARFVLRQGPLYLLRFAADDACRARPIPQTTLVPSRCAMAVTTTFGTTVGTTPRVPSRDGRTWFYVNIATPAEFDGAQFRCVDLDLDVSWFVGDEPRVLDEDEFLAHSEAMRYPAGVIERARAAVDEVLGMIGQRAFPFDRA